MISRNGLIGFGIFGVVAATFLVFESTADAQKAQNMTPFADAPGQLRCFQNGVEIMTIDTSNFVSRGRSDYFMEYITKDGRLGQIRFAIGTTCSIEEGRKNSPSR